MTVDLNGGMSTQKIDGAYKTGTTKTLTIPTRTGYTFTGWTRESGNSILSGNTLTVGTEDTKIKANWRANLKSIAVTTNPTKTNYAEGENFNSSGMVVKATYYDETSKVITNYTVKNGNNLVNGTNSLTISYTENGITKETTVDIIVDGTPPILTVNSVIPETTLNDTLSISGTAEDSSGIDSVIVSVGNNMHEVTIETNGNWSVSVKLYEGENAVSIVAKDKLGNETRLDYNVTFKTDCLVYISMQNVSSLSSPVTLTINDNTYTAMEGLQDGTTLTLPIGTIITFNLSARGANYTSSLSLNGILGPQVTGSGSGFSSTCNSVSYDYVVSSDVTISITGSEGSGVFEYGGQIDINTSNVVQLMRIGVTSSPVKTIYFAGDAFDKSGMVVFKYYSDGSSQVITDYTILDGNSLLEDQTYVTISYTEKDTTVTTKQTINIRKFEAFAIYSADDNSLRFYKNYDLLTINIGSIYNGKVVTAIYSDIEKERYSSSRPGWYNDGNNASIITVSFEDNIKPISLHHMFQGCTNLKNIINLNKLDTSNVTDMSVMFYDCSSLTSLDLSSFNTAKVEDMSDMFSGCSSLTSVNVTSFNTSYSGSLYGMFSGCSSLTSLDLSSFDTITSKPVISWMFEDCVSLKTIYVSERWYQGYNDANYYTFDGCTSLVGAVSYNPEEENGDYANYTTGYLTYKAAS